MCCWLLAGAGRKLHPSGYWAMGDACCWQWPVLAAHVVMSVLPAKVGVAQAAVVA
jgi:hypothetical protein